MTSKTKMPVTIRAVTQRVNRKLKLNMEMLKATHPQVGKRWRKEYGNYYVINFRKGVVTQTHVDLEKLARTLDVLKPWEELQ